MRRDSPADIAARLAHIRADARQPDHAKALGVPLRTYQNYERGEREPDLRTYLGLIDKGWNINWLLTGVGPERLDASFSGVSGQSQDLIWDRETLLRAERILTLALDMARVEIGPTARARMLGDVYEHLLRRGFDGDQVVSLASDLNAQLKQIQEERDALPRQPAGAAAGDDAEG